MIDVFSASEGSQSYIKAYLLRLLIFAPILYALLYFTNIWPGFEITFFVVMGYMTIHHLFFYFLKREKESKKKREALYR